jgi:mannose-6-phosphate isomerase-like protein (cupin superfamily)
MRMTTTKYRAESPPTGETFEFARSARSTEDKTFRFVWTLAPKKRGPGEHYHEDAVETFEIVSGTLRIWLDGEPKDYHPGDFVAIPPRVPHRFLNPGDEPVVVNVTLEGTRLEDTLVPIGVAVYGRKGPRLGELLRMFVAIAKLRPSIPTSRLERTFFLSVLPACSRRSA